MPYVGRVIREVPRLSSSGGNHQDIASAGADVGVKRDRLTVGRPAWETRNRAQRCELDGIGTRRIGTPDFQLAGPVRHEGHLSGIR